MAQRFLLDVMLGKLATYLRMCGYDTLYALEEDIEADDGSVSAQRRPAERSSLGIENLLHERIPQSSLHHGILRGNSPNCTTTGSQLNCRPNPNAVASATAVSRMLILNNDRNTPRHSNPHLAVRGV